MSLMRSLRRRFNPNIGDIIVFERYRAIYFAIPKVANSSLKAISAELLKSDIDPSFLDSQWGAKPFRDRESRRSLKERRILIEQCDLGRYREYWKFCFVRNPWDRLVSCFTEKIDRHSEAGLGDRRRDGGVFAGLDGFHPGMSFEAFVLRVCEIPDGPADRHFKSQHLFVTDRKRRLLVDNVGRFETLDRDFEFALRKMGAGDLKIPHLLKSKRRDYKEYYTPRLKDLVAERYRGDIGLFGYDF